MVSRMKTLDSRARSSQANTQTVMMPSKRPERLISDRGTLFLVAADHPARGALRSGSDPMAMADRRGLLERLVTALGRPGVDGMLGSPDVVEELLLLGGALDGKVIIGSMNRGGLDGAAWTMDDRFTGYDAESIAASRLEGGKMLLRIDDDDPAVANTIENCAAAVTALAARGADGDGRIAAVQARSRRAAGTADRRCVADPGRDGGLRAGHDQRVHLAEDACL